MTQIETAIRAAAFLFALASAAASAQVAIPGTAPVVPAQPVRPRVRTPKPEQAAMNPNVVLLDPGHGAADNGATFPDNTLEKDLTLALANRLRTALTSKGFTVVMTRENSADDVSADARVELSNRTHPLACLLLHAASGGQGLHLYTSSLAARNSVAPSDPQAIQPWDTAQAAALAQSVRLVSDLTASLNGIRVPLVTGHASDRPIDSLTCPAVALEMAPLGRSGEARTSVADSNYQQRVADAVAQGLVFWRGHAVSAAVAAEALKSGPGAPAVPAPVVKLKPKPRPVATPSAPDAVAPAPAHTPAPIVRKAPEPATPPAGPPQ